MTLKFHPPYEGLTFGFDGEQFNLAATRLQELMSQQWDLATAKAGLGVPTNGELVEMPIAEMSQSVLVSFLTQLIVANNAVLTRQLREVGIQPASSAKAPGIGHQPSE